jgi:hypothetical protein
MDHTLGLAEHAITDPSSSLGPNALLSPDVRIPMTAQHAMTLPPGAEPPVFPATGFGLDTIPDDLELDDVFDEAAFDPAWFNLDPDIYYDNKNNSCGFIPNAQIIDEVDRNDFRPTTERADVTTGTPMSLSNLNTLIGTDSLTGTGE